jgi:hypothetical protein
MADAVISPNEAAATRIRRATDSEVAITAGPAMSVPSKAMCRMVWPITRPKIVRPTTCIHSSHTIVWWRRRTMCSGSICPCGSHARAAANARAGRAACAVQGRRSSATSCSAIR